MPVILHEDDYAKWLDPNNSFEDVKDLLKPFDSELMKAEPVKA